MKGKSNIILCVILTALILTATPLHASEPATDVTTIAGTVDQLAAEVEPAPFNMPMGIAAGPGGEIFIADTFNNLIRIIEESGEVTSLNLHTPLLDIWGFPIGGHIDRYLDEAMFGHPTGIALGLHGWLFVADSQNNAVRVIIGDRAYTIAGGFGEGFADGVQFDAHFNNPTAIAVGPGGAVYVADTSNHAIRRIDLQGNVTTIAGVAGQYGYANGAQDAALFDSPMGLAFGQDGQLFIADTGNHVIRVLYDGYVTTYAGSHTVPQREGFGEWDDAPIGGFTDGNAANANFNRPIGLTVFDGILFVADSGNHAIRAITDGEVVTVTGSGHPGFVDGELSAAEFHMPGTLFVHDGILFVADTGNNAIRAIELSVVLDIF